MDYGNSCQGTQIKQGRIHGSAASGICGEATAIPTSPIFSGVNRQRELISQVRAQIEQLAQRLMPVLANNPCQAPECERKSMESTCELDSVFNAHNQSLERCVELLNEMSGAVRL